jgi:CheY-like chemotaxis protein
MVPEPVILIVDDSEDDVLLVRTAFEKAGLTNPVYVLRDGQEAIDYLSGTGAFTNRAEHPLPDLILLDLKMPRMDGFQVLDWIRKQPGIRSIPVVVLTTTQQMAEVNRAYSIGANSFLVKPMDFSNYVELSKLIRHYWMQSVRLPETFRPPPKPSGTEAKASD